MSYGFVCGSEKERCKRDVHLILRNKEEEKKYRKQKDEKNGREGKWRKKGLSAATFRDGFIHLKFRTTLALTTLWRCNAIDKWTTSESFSHIFLFSPTIYRLFPAKLNPNFNMMTGMKICETANILSASILKCDMTEHFSCVTERCRQICSMTLRLPRQRWCHIRHDESFVYSYFFLFYSWKNCILFAPNLSLSSLFLKHQKRIESNTPSSPFRFTESFSERPSTAYRWQIILHRHPIIIS